MSACYPPEDFGEGAAEDFIPFSISLWVLLFFFFSLVRVVLNARFSAAVKVPMTELYSVFWDIPIPRCVLIVLGKLLSLGCWSFLSFFQEILELIPVLCLPVEC